MIRIQRKRIKGWKMPENTVSVTRGTEFGNPFKIGHYYIVGGPSKFGTGWIYIESYEPDHKYTLIKTNQDAVDMYRKMLKNHPLKPAQIEKLRGKNLACWCKPDQPCHADVLLEIVNG